MIKKHKIAAIIPTFNRIKYLEKVLDLLEKQMSDCFVLNCYVINDGCSDGTQRILKEKFPAVTQILGNGNWWYTKCINEGIKSARSSNPDYYLLLNDDIEFDKHYVNTLLLNSIEFSEPAIIGSISLILDSPNEIYFSGVHQISWWRSKFHCYHRFAQRVNHNQLSGLHKSLVLSGRGMFISKEIINRIGIFDERFLQYGSDDEYCLRASKLGFAVLISWDAKVYSHHKLTGIGTPYLTENLYQYTKSFFNRYSRNYVKKNFILYLNYGRKILLPISLITLIIGDYYSFFKNKLLKLFDRTWINNE